jgi:hypothetical protein
MTSNPFDAITQQITELAIHVHQIAQRQDRILAKLERKAPEWESMVTASTTRRKSRRSLREAIDAGRIAVRREKSHGGFEAYLLKVADLDEHFPRRE